MIWCYWRTRRTRTSQEYALRSTVKICTFACQKRAVQIDLKRNRADTRQETKDTCMCFLCSYSLVTLLYCTIHQLYLEAVVMKKVRLSIHPSMWTCSLHSHSFIHNLHRVHIKPRKSSRGTYSSLPVAWLRGCLSTIRGKRQDTTRHSTSIRYAILNPLPDLLNIAIAIEFAGLSPLQSLPLPILICPQSDSPVLLLICKSEKRPN